MECCIFSFRSGQTEFKVCVVVTCMPPLPPPKKKKKRRRRRKIRRNVMHKMLFANFAFINAWSNVFVSVEHLLFAISLTVALFSF